jgi:sugar O-acyltransferase (sialic acid O-acetyltransferase NeuD family)
MRRELVIVGAGGLAREVAMVAERINALTREWRFLGFVDGSEQRLGESVGSSTIVGTDEWLANRREPTDVVVAIGQPHLRADVTRRIRGNCHLSFPNLIHPNVSIDATRVEFGIGNVITAGVALTCDIEVGDFNYFNLNVTVGHDVRIGSFDVLNPGANVSGGVVIGNQVLVGTGAQLLEGVDVRDRAIVGAGAVVVQDVAEDETVVGVPAKPLHRSTHSSA